MSPSDMTPTLTIVGGGAHAREVLDVLRALTAAGQSLCVRGVVTEAGADVDLLEARGIAILGGLDVLLTSGTPYVIAIGDSTTRRRIDRMLTARGAVPFPALVHPSAVVGSEVVLEPGVVVFPHASVACDTRLGRHVHVHRSATVGHDVVVGPYSTIAPGAAVSGRVEVGAAVTVGTGACVVERVRIGDGTFVGAGAAVVNDLPPGVLALGVPARTAGDAP